VFINGFDKVSELAAFFEKLYERYQRTAYVRPDPLQFVRDFDDPLEQEVVGLVAASLAYGRVRLIVQNIRRVLASMMPSPRRQILDGNLSRVSRQLRGFKHRFTDADDLCRLLAGVRRVLRRHGSLQTCFCLHRGPGDETVLEALTGLVSELAGPNGRANYLLPRPEKGSACKRLHLYLRWMVRRDEVDPGPWRSVSPALLVMPLDTHILRICRQLGATSCRAATRKAALEVTGYFGQFVPEDPTKYDFALTRAAFRRDPELQHFLIRQMDGKLPQ